MSKEYRCRRLRTAPRRAVQIMLLAVLAAGIAAAWHLRGVFDPIAIAAVIGRYPAAPLVFLGLHIAASLLFLPRTVLAIAAGLVFGTMWGVVWAATGSVLGAVAGFCLARYINSGLIDLDRYPRIGPILDGIGRGGWRSVALLRLIPVIPHSLANYALGLRPMPLIPYAFGSLIGQLPMTIACADLGAAGENLVLGSGGWVLPTAIGAAALGLSLVVPVVARRSAE